MKLLLSSFCVIIIILCFGCKDDFIPNAPLYLSNSLSVNVSERYYYADKNPALIPFTIINNSNYDQMIYDVFVEKSVSNNYQKSPLVDYSMPSNITPSFCRNSSTLRLNDTGIFRIGVVCGWKSRSGISDTVYSAPFNVVPVISNIPFRTVSLNALLMFNDYFNFVIQSKNGFDSLRHFFIYGTDTTFYNLLSKTDFSKHTLFGTTGFDGTSGNGFLRIDNLALIRDTLHVQSSIKYSTFGYCEPNYYLVVVETDKFTGPVVFDEKKIIK